MVCPSTCFLLMYAAGHHSISDDLHTIWAYDRGSAVLSLMSWCGLPPTILQFPHILACLCELHDTNVLERSLHTGPWCISDIVVSLIWQRAENVMGVRAENVVMGVIKYTCKSSSRLCLCRIQICRHLQL